MVHGMESDVTVLFESWSVQRRAERRKRRNRCKRAFLPIRSFPILVSQLLRCCCCCCGSFLTLSTGRILESVRSTFPSSASERNCYRIMSWFGFGGSKDEDNSSSSSSYDSPSFDTSPSSSFPESSFDNSSSFPSSSSSSFAPSAGSGGVSDLQQELMQTQQQAMIKQVM